MGILLAFPVLILMAMLQTTLVSSLPLLHGTADLLLLVVVAWGLQERVTSGFEWAALAGLIVGGLSAVPLWVPLAGYLGAALLARLLRQRVWQSPLLAMAVTTFVGSILVEGLTMLVLIVQGVPLPILGSLNQVVLPGAFLNMLLALPVFALVADLARFVYPEEVET